MLKWKIVIVVIRVMSIIIGFWNVFDVFCQTFNGFLMESNEMIIFGSSPWASQTVDPPQGMTSIRDIA